MKLDDCEKEVLWSVTEAAGQTTYTIEAYAVCVELIRGGGDSESMQRAIDGAISVLKKVDP
jgi:hypothetical protein